MIILLLLPFIYLLLKDILITIRSYKTYKRGFRDGVRSSAYIFEGMKYEITEHPDYLKTTLIVEGLINVRM